MTMAELPDPSPHISEMSQGQLRTFVEELVRSHSRNGDRLTHGMKDTRPSWWPPDVAWINPHIRTRRHSQQQVWSDALRKVVRSCYKHHGQEHRLQATTKPETAAQEETEDDADLCIISMTENTVSCIDKVALKTENSDYEAKMPALESRLPEAVPTSGPIPSKAICTWKKEEFPRLAALPEAEAATVNSTQKDDNPFVEIFICFYCEKEFEDRNHLQGHQQSCCKSNSKVKKVRRSAVRPGLCRQTHPDTYKRPEHKLFVEAVGLIPRSKLATFQKRKNKEEIKFEEIEIDECPIPKTPTTPRSAKSLISQLSRDLSPPPSAAKLRRFVEDDGEALEAIEESKEGEKDTDAESVCSNKSDTVESGFNMRKIPSLLAIDLCSLLGQRVKKHVDKLDSSERTSYEDFCHTPVKKNALDRLRNRPSLFPVTFRKTKRLCPPQCHWYKFTKRDKREFMRVLATGLSKRARRLKRLMTPCRVVLRRLKGKDIVQWTTPKKHPTMIQQIRGTYPGYQQTWQFVTHQDGQRVLIKNAYPQQSQRFIQPQQQQQNERQLSHLMRMGQQLGLPLKTLNSAMAGHSLPQQNRAYKAVLSNVARTQPHLMPPQGGMSNLNMYPLPLSAPIANRNFGKALQPGGFYGPSPVRTQTLGPNNKGHRPNILSKENGAMHRNRTVRRLSMDGQAKAGELTAEHLRQLPSSVPRKKPEDDVISISSTESESEEVSSSSGSKKRSLPEDRNNNNNSSASKRPRLSAGAPGTQVVLFRCHLCQAEITCKLGQTDFIKKHFAERHAVSNIHLLEHMDSNNQKVVTIVEDNGPKTSPKSSSLSAGKAMPRLSNGADRPTRNVPAGGRAGPNTAHTLPDRAVLKDPVYHGQGHMFKGRVRHSGRDQEDQDRRTSDGKPRRTNVLDSGPPAEIIILD